MKQVFIAATTLSLCLCSCTQTIVVHPSDTETMARYGYVKAKPSPAKVYASNPDAAFDQQVAAYSAEKSTSAPVAPPATSPSYTSNTTSATPLNVADIISPIVTNPVTTAIATSVGGASTAPAIPAPQATASVVPSAPVAPVVAPAAPIIPAQPAQNENVGVMDYKVKVTNGTTNRLFIEAQDANGTIYPCGFMQPGQSETTKMEQVQAMAGPVLVVVRDPDQPGAPELRRYRIPTPNQSYSGKTVEFTVIPKGSYAGAIDGQTYVQSGADD
ncbi:MAG: hypothetical protein R3Y56_01790 [Akkermansia sp.]